MEHRHIIAYFQLLACFAATMGSFVMGTAIGWSGPALPLLKVELIGAP